MIVKVGDRYADPNKEPIMLVFKDDNDRQLVMQQLRAVKSGCLKWCTFPEKMPIEEVDKFMEIDKKPEVNSEQA